jgi:hypothetical protein
MTEGDSKEQKTGMGGSLEAKERGNLFKILLQKCLKTYYGATLLPKLIFSDHENAKFHGFSTNIGNMGIIFERQGITTGKKIGEVRDGDGDGNGDGRLPLQP